MNEAEKNEEVVSFKQSDRMTYGAVNYDGTEMMAVISGYDLNIAFNMRTINSLSDAEASADALAQVFYELLMEQLIEEKSYLVKHHQMKPLFLNIQRKLRPGFPSGLFLESKYGRERYKINQCGD